MSEEAAEYKADRSGYGRGEWDHEPDKVLWEHDGFDCMVVRGPLGSLCGYVGVREGHPWFGKDYDAVNADVHGGLTYGSFCQGHICHPKPEKTFWLGFDCAHSGDLVPGMAKYSERNGRGETYKDLAWVKAEVHSLVEQAKDAQ